MGEDACVLFTCGSLSCRRIHMTTPVRFAEEKRTQQAQITLLSNQLDKLKKHKPVPAPREGTSLMTSKTVPPGDKINVLKKGIFDYIPGAVNIN